MKLFTIGFTKTSAQHFFTRLRGSGARLLADVRLNNVSQLAGFAKREDLKWFAGELAGIPYRHLPQLAPTQDLLDRYKKQKGDWSSYADDFLELMRTRRIEQNDPAMLDGACLLCSEDTPHHCHRRLVAEYLRAHWGDVEIVHL
jgi:uncharacterized protein (DUF488 family)